MYLAGLGNVLESMLFQLKKSALTKLDMDSKMISVKADKIDVTQHSFPKVSRWGQLYK